MVSSNSLSDIFGSENSEELKCDKLSTIPTAKDTSSDGSNDPEVKVCVSSENNSFVDNSSDGKLVKREGSEDPLSWYLHLSEELNSNKHPDGISGTLESHSSETYISLNTPSLSSEDSKDNLCNNEMISDKNLYPNTPDMFSESQEIIGTTENTLSKNILTKIKDHEPHENSETSNEEHIQERSSESCSQISRSSSDSEGYPEISSISDEEHNSHDFQCSQDSYHDSPGPRVSTDPHDCPSDCRERQEEWGSEELNQVSERLALRKKQARRLILSVIRKRQMAEETLDAFKKRLKKF